MGNAITGTLTYSIDINQGENCFIEVINPNLTGDNVIIGKFVSSEETEDLTTTTVSDEVDAFSFFLYKKVVELIADSTVTDYKGSLYLSFSLSLVLL